MKITLHDIMESLNSENMEDAQAALHEWFVGKAAEVHANLTGPINENIDDDQFDVLDGIVSGRAQTESEGYEQLEEMGNDDIRMTCAWIRVDASTEEEMDQVDVQAYLPKLEKLAMVMPGTETDNQGVYSTLIHSTEQPVVTIVFAFYDESTGLNYDEENMDESSSDDLTDDDMGESQDIQVLIPGHVDADAVEELIATVFANPDVRTSRDDKTLLHYDDGDEEIVGQINSALASNGLGDAGIEVSVTGGVDEAVVAEAPRNVDRSHQDVYAALQQIVPTLQANPAEQATLASIVKAVKGRGVGQALSMAKKLSPQTQAALKPAFAKWQGMGGAKAAAPAAGGFTGDPKTDAQGWATIAQENIKKFSQMAQDPELDALQAEDIEYIVDCAQSALPLFQQGDIEGGLTAMMPDANAQDFLSGNVGPENYESYFFHRTSESVDPTFESLMAELSESFKGLETVSDKLQNQEGAQVGEQGKVPVNTKATLPSHKAKDRVGGEAVEIKGKGHTGHALEKAPKVTDVKVRGNVQNSKDDPKKVPAEKSALLNKMDGSVNTQSPISGKGAKGLKK